MSLLHSNITFLRRGPLNSPFEVLDIMPSGIIRELGISSTDLTLNRTKTYELIRARNKSAKFTESDMIFSAQSRRCQSTAILIRNFVKKVTGKTLEIMVLPCMNEIRFNLPKLYPKILKEYSKADTRALDNIVLDAILIGNNSDSISNIEWRIEYLASILQRQVTTDKRAVVISHDYFMRVVQLYIVKRQLARTTLKEFKSMQHNLPVHGFSTNASLSAFDPLPVLGGEVSDKRASGITKKS